MSAIPVSVGPHSAPVPPTLYVVMTVQADAQGDGVRLSPVGVPHGSLDAADRAARASGLTCVVMRWTPISVFRGLASNAC